MIFTTGPKVDRDSNHVTKSQSSGYLLLTNIRGMGGNLDSSKKTHKQINELRLD